MEWIGIKWWNGTEPIAFDPDRGVCDRLVGNWVIIQFSAEGLLVMWPLPIAAPGSRQMSCSYWKCVAVAEGRYGGCDCGCDYDCDCDWNGFGFNAREF
jgi:hypothetical protein